MDGDLRAVGWQPALIRFGKLEVLTAKRHGPSGDRGVRLVFGLIRAAPNPHPNLRTGLRYTNRGVRFSPRPLLPTKTCQTYQIARKRLIPLSESLAGCCQKTCPTLDKCLPKTRQISGGDQPSKQMSATLGCDSEPRDAETEWLADVYRFCLLTNEI